jgi:DNA modification methylase
MNDGNTFEQLSIVYLPIDTLTAYSHNARTHSKQQIRQIAASIRTFGFTNPVLISGDNTMIAGHGRVAAAKLLGMKRVPTIRLEDLTDDQIRAYVIADNRLAENSNWDKAILSIELQHLMTLATFDVTITGFDVPEIDLIIEEEKEERQDEDDVFKIDETAKSVTQPGDLWQLGKHRVLCGDSLDDASFKTLMGRRQANLVFADPPYNVAIDGHVSGNGSIRHREFVMGSGEMNEAQFMSFLTTSLRQLARHSTENSVHFICIDWRHMWEMLAAGKHVYNELLNVCVWVKDNGGMGSFYRSRHELVFVFRNGKGRHQNNIQLGQFGRNRTNVWEYAGANTLSRQSDEGNLLVLHPTVKPVALVADAILDCSARGEIVMDSFLGSGSTLIAAERVGRICFGIEIDPLYVDVAIQRWQKHTGDRAIHAATGRPFDDAANGVEVRHDR